MIARSQRKLCLLCCATRADKRVGTSLHAIRATTDERRATSERASELGVPFRKLLLSGPVIMMGWLSIRRRSLTVRLHAHAWRGAWASRIPYIIHPPLPSSSVCESRGGRACMFPRIVANRPSIPKEPFTAFLKANRDFHCTYNAARL